MHLHFTAVNETIIVNIYSRDFSSYRNIINHHPASLNTTFWNTTKVVGPNCVYLEFYSIIYSEIIFKTYRGVSQFDAKYLYIRICTP